MTVSSTMWDKTTIANRNKVITIGSVAFQQYQHAVDFEFTGSKGYEFTLGPGTQLERVSCGYGQGGKLLV